MCPGRPKGVWGRAAILESTSSGLGSQELDDTCALTLLERLVYNILYVPPPHYVHTCSPVGLGALR